MTEQRRTTEPATPSRDLTAIFHRNEARDTFRISYMANSLVLPVYDDIKREFGLSRGEYLLLFCLAHLPELTAQDVTNMTGRPRNSISRAVHRMLTEGYLDRTPDPEDGRQAMLRITSKGRKFHGVLKQLKKHREKLRKSYSLYPKNWPRLNTLNCNSFRNSLCGCFIFFCSSFFRFCIFRFS